MLRINEIFYSLQGEGNRSGSANIFIRLAGCNMKCKFCDTKHDNYDTYSLGQILARLQLYSCQNIVWTGGEPCKQLTTEIVQYFHRYGYYQALETNGTLSIPDGLNWVTVSPKNKLHKSIMKCDELKILYQQDSDIRQFDIKADHLYLSPIFNGQDANYEVINNCINYIKDNPKWKLSLQLHKLINIA